MNGIEKKSILILIYLIPIVLGVLTSLPLMSLGNDSETVILFTHPLTFGDRTLNVVPFFTFDQGLPSLLRLWYRPLYFCSFTLDYILFKSNSFLPRLENLLILLIVIFLTMRMARKLGMKITGMLVCGVFLALHPAHAFMLIYLYSRTDFVVAFFMIIIVNLFVSEKPNSKITIRLIIAYIVFLLSIFWKENMIILPFVIFVGDIACGWTTGSAWKRFLLYLPFLIISFISVAMQYYFTGGFGYSHFGPTQNMSSIFAFIHGLPFNVIPYFEKLWSINLLDINSTLPDTFKYIISAAILQIILLIIGPTRRCRIMLIISILLLMPYFIIFSSYMHIFVASLALALWAGFFTEDILKLKLLFLKYVVLGVFCILLLASWFLIYLIPLRSELEISNYDNNIVNYIYKKYKPPGENTIFIINDCFAVADENYKRKSIFIINLKLQIKYKRKDILVKCIDNNALSEGYNEKNGVAVDIPSNIQLNK